MGSGITERTELYEILAKIADNVNQYDSYPSMRLYYNEMDRTARIWRTLNEDDEIEIIAIFNPERILLNQSDYYAGALLKNVIVRTDDIGVNEIGLGGFIDYDRLVENICIALGVKLGNNFAKNNPTIWQELKECCQKYIGNVNNAPYFMVEQNSSLYMSYVPEAMIIEVAIYLANLGIFGSDDITLFNSCVALRPNWGYYCGSYYDTFYGGDIVDNTGLATLAQYYDKVDDLYGLLSKSDLLSKVNKFFDTTSYYTTQIKESAKSVFNAMLTEYELEIDWTNIVFINFRENDCRITTIPKDCLFTMGQSSQGGNCNLTVYNNVSDFIITHYYITYNTSTQEYTYSKTIKQGLQNTTLYYSVSSLYALSNHYTVSNINYNKYMKYYAYNPSIPYGTNSQLSTNVLYENIKVTPIKYIFSGSTLAWLKYNGVTFNDDDLILFYASATGGRLTIFRHLKKLKITSNNGAFLSYAYWNSYYISTSYNIISGRYETNSGTNKNKVTTNPNSTVGVTLDFGETLQYEEYRFDADRAYAFNNWVFELLDSGSASQWTASSNYSTLSWNVSEMITIEPEEVVTDLTLEPGATYPANVIDKASFITTYPSWLYLTSKQPKYDEDGFIIDATTDTNWLSLDVGEPANQAEAQAGDLDNVELDILVRDIDKAEEDDDSGENPDLVSEGEDEGTTELIDPDSLPDAFEGGLIYQDKMTVNELRAFALYARTFHVDEWVFGKVIDKVIALAQTYDGLWNSTLSTDNQNIIIGGVDTGCTATSVAKSVKHIWCGTVDINPFFENYNDITETTLSLYLPFVGMVDLDIRDFHNKVVGLTADVDSFTGSIVYSVFDYEDQDTYRLLYTYSGNCQQLLPLEATDFSQLLRNVANTAISATTTALTLI